MPVTNEELVGAVLPQLGNDNYTAAELTALAAAGGLTPYATYVASDTGDKYWADSASSILLDGVATYDTEQIEHLAGTGENSSLLALAVASNYPRRFAVDWSNTASRKVVAAAATFTSAYTITNPSGNLMRIASAGVHGLGAGSDGKYLYVKTSAGVPSGLYAISTRAVTTEIDVDVGAANQSLIATTTVTAVSLVGVAFVPPENVMTIPAGIMGANGRLYVSMLWEASNTTNLKYLRFRAGTTSTGATGTLAGEATLSSTSVYVFSAGNMQVVNQNATNAQRASGMQQSNTAVAVSLSIDTTATSYHALEYQITTLDEYIEVLGWLAEVLPLN